MLHSWPTFCPIIWVQANCHSEATNKIHVYWSDSCQMLAPAKHVISSQTVLGGKQDWAWERGVDCTVGWREGWCLQWRDACAGLSRRRRPALLTTRPAVLTCQPGDTWHSIIPTSDSSSWHRLWINFNAPLGFKSNTGTTYMKYTMTIKETFLQFHQSDKSNIIKACRYHPFK